MIQTAAQIVPRDPATQVRPVTTADELVRQLFKTAGASDFAAAKLPDAQLDMLLDLQYREQTAGCAAEFPDAMSLIVLKSGQPVGRLILAIADTRWHIVDIVLLPAMRGRGIGADIMESVVVRAAASERAREVSLSVFAGNAAARRLYHRLGFVETGTGMHVPMAKRL